MDSGTTRAIVLAAFALAAASALLLTGGEPALFLNGRRLEGLETLRTGGGVSVPLEEAARLFGARVDTGGGDGYVVEWGKTGSFLVDEEEIVRSGDFGFVDVDFLAENLGGEVDKSGGKIDVKVPPSRLLSASARSNEVSLNFAKYANFTRSRREDGVLEVKFFNAERGSVAEEIGLPSDSEDIGSARLVEGEQGSLLLLLEHREGLEARVKTSRGETGFHFRIEFPPPDGDQAPALPPVGGSQDYSYNRMRVRSGSGGHTLHYLKVSRWRSNYRLLPVIAGGKLGKGEDLGRLVRSNLGVAGLNANFFDPATYYPVGLVVRDGKLLSKSWGGRAALGIDYFGRLKFFRPEVRLFLRTPEGEVEIEGLNRPASPGELVAYTSEYGGDLPSSNSSLFLTVKDGSLVDRSHSPPSSVGPEERLVVATGDARSRLNGLNQGEEVEYAWRSDPPASLLRGAVSAGPLLVKDGRAALSLEEENFDRGSGLVESRARRSVLATTGDGELLFMVISNGGIGLEELPSLLLGAGLNIENAIAFDGGSSAGIIYRDGVSIKSIGGDRRVPVGLVLVSRP